MIKMLQVSDLHIVENAHWNNLKLTLLEKVTDEFGALPEGHKLLVMTGDYQNYNETDYEKATLFIKELVRAMKIDIAEDVFMIPGNHDMSPMTTEVEKVYHNAIVQMVKQDILLLQNDTHIKLLLEPFSAYSDFCKSLGVYSNDASPASVHIRTWRDKLDLIHINTCLVADGKELDKQLVDTKTVTGLTVEGDKPRIVLGHNSYYDLHEDIQKAISAAFKRYKVKAYLCGDRHKFEKHRNEQYIRLGEGYVNAPLIPNIVCGKSTADVKDVYSDFGCFIHEWNQNTNLVKLRSLVWNPNQDQGRFIERNDGVYDLNDDALASSKFEENHDNESSEIPQEVFENYCNYIRTQCSEIELNGLPLDEEQSKRRFELSSIYIPAALEYTVDGRANFLKRIGRINSYNLIPQQDSFHHLILAAPGAGKTTLLKAIASFYCLPEIYGDKYSFTQRDLFPIWIRCRDLKGDDLSIWNAIKNIEKLGEWKPVSDINSKGIIDLVNIYIKNKKALLLIDGLDEIGSDAGRQSFVNHLKQFIENYPSINVIITSREKGFTIVSDNSFNGFTRFRIALLDDHEIENMCVKWYALIYGDTAYEREEGRKLAVERILPNEKIKILARNPLMLMTLLLVNRRIGRLPTKRAGLYFEATRVLLETWNSNYHNEITIDIDEAKYQLAYVAFHMTTNYTKYKNRINRTELWELLTRVRNEFSNYVPGSDTIDNVLKTVERRSGILVQTGTNRMLDGHSEPVYEFQHLTFQEYLAAFAVDRGCYPDASKSKYKGSVLVPFLEDSNMKEVILLFAAISGECADKLCDIILKKITGGNVNSERDNILRDLLLQFVVDEVPLSRNQIDCIFEKCLFALPPYEKTSIVRQIVAGKFKHNLELFVKEKDDKQHDEARYWTSLLEVETGKIDPYSFFNMNKNSHDSTLRLRSLYYLIHSRMIQYFITLNGDSPNTLRSDLLYLSEENNRNIANAALRLLSNANIIHSNMSKYCDSIVTYINRFQEIPPIMLFCMMVQMKDLPSAYEKKQKTPQMPVSLKKESIDLICNTIKEDGSGNEGEYIERKLTLLYIIILYCNDYETIDMIYSVFSEMIKKSDTLIWNLDSIKTFIRKVSTADDIPQRAVEIALKYMEHL